MIIKYYWYSFCLKLVSDEEEIIKNPKKRNRVIHDDTDSDESDLPKQRTNTKKAKLISVVDYDDEEMKSSSIKLLDFEQSSTTSIDKLKRDVTLPSASKSCTEAITTTKWKHEKLEFLKPDKILDINKNKPNHPEYDYKTLYVPESYLISLTPAMRQWWELKSKHFDTVLFFKVGKFYELYHMDATVGVNHLGFSYMKV